jgi:hypothetical protein
VRSVTIFFAKALRSRDSSEVSESPSKSSKLSSTLTTLNLSRTSLTLESLATRFNTSSSKKSGSIASGDLLIANGKNGIIRGFGKKEIEFTFKVIYRLESGMRDNFLENVEEKDLLTFSENSSHFANSRNLQGEIFNFNNFVYNNQISFNSRELQSLSIIDSIPDQLDILFSSINIELVFYKTFFRFKHENLSYAFDIKIKEAVEEQNPVVPFTYENKKNVHIYFTLKEEFIKNHLNLNNIIEEDTDNSRKNKSDLSNIIKINISYELRKRLLNFESYENEAEYGYKFPCGLIIFNKTPIPTNHIYFNIHLGSHPHSKNTISSSSMLQDGCIK